MTLQAGQSALYTIMNQSPKNAFLNISYVGNDSTGDAKIAQFYAYSQYTDPVLNLPVTSKLYNMTYLNSVLLP